MRNFYNNNNNNNNNNNDNNINNHHHHKIIKSNQSNHHQIITYALDIIRERGDIDEKTLEYLMVNNIEIEGLECAVYCFAFVCCVIRVGSQDGSNVGKRFL